MSIGAQSLLKELTSVFGLIFLLLILISVGGRFSGYVDEVVEGRIPAEMLGSVLALRLPEFIQLVIPLSLFISVLITLGRYHSEQEFSVLLMGGLSPTRLLSWLGIVVLPLTVTVALFSMWLSPLASSKFDDLMDSVKAEDSIQQLPTAVIKTFDNGRQMVFVEEIEKERQQLIGVVTAKIDANRIDFSYSRNAGLHPTEDGNSRDLRLHNGIFWSMDLDTDAIQWFSFNQFRNRVFAPPESDAPEISKKPISELDLSVAEHIAELHWRISLPLMTLIVVLCGIGVSRVQPRRGRFSRIAPGLIIFITYVALIVVCRNLLVQSDLLAWIGLLPIHCMFGGLGWWLLQRSWKPT